MLKILYMGTLCLPRVLDIENEMVGFLDQFGIKAA